MLKCCQNFTLADYYSTLMLGGILVRYFIMENKKCINCNTIKPLNADYFHNRKDSKDGFRNSCRVCCNEKSTDYHKNNKERAKEYTRKNRDKLNSQMRDYRKKNPEKFKEYESNRNKEVVNENNRKRLAIPANKIKKLIQNNAWRDKNREHVNLTENIRRHKFRAANREKHNNKVYERRDKVKQSGNFSLKDWLEIKNKYENKCLCCGKKEGDIKLSMDHVIPISKDGKNIAENIQPLCVGCNSKKGVKVIDYRRF